MHFLGSIYEPRQVQSPVAVTLSSVWVGSDGCAWAVGQGGTVLRWDGRAWFPVCMAGKSTDLHAVWGHGGSIWIGGKNTLIRYQGGDGGTLITSDFAIVAIWGSGPDDMWFLTHQPVVLHWNGISCTSMALPEGEYGAISGGADDEPVWIVGASGSLLRGDGEGWQPIDAGTEANLTGVLTMGESDLWTTDDAGQLRHLDASGWHVAAFNVFGGLSGLCEVDGVIWAAGDHCIVIQHRPSDEGGE
ncbi:MAG: hypothetical protein HY369_02805 [Candidatus Aenigmarchaeota archaeon]|nr:hypothetical protein [Candidatus Aenigmarchaeota archaeon]